jgi:hypothetical protein
LRLRKICKPVGETKGASGKAAQATHEENNRICDRGFSDTGSGGTNHRRTGMTAEEKTWEVLMVLEGENLAEARQAIAEKFADDWFCFCTGSGCTGWISRTALFYRTFLAETLGEETLERILDEEFEKFGKTIDPEHWRIYCHGTQEEVDALEQRLQEETLTSEESETRTQP